MSKIRQIKTEIGKNSSFLLVFIISSTYQTWMKHSAMGVSNKVLKCNYAQ